MPLVVLPDEPVEPSLLERIACEVGPALVRHPSGMPWLLGATGGRRMVRASNGSVTVVLVGLAVSPTDEEALAARLRGKASVNDLDELAAVFAEGDTLLFARDGHALRCQGPLFLTRSVFWINEDGHTVISDEQMVLRDIACLDPDEAVLASRLTDAELSYPFSLNSIWRGVQTMRPGQWLRCVPGRAPDPVTWWQPPAPESSIGELAPRLHDAVLSALGRRIAPHEIVSADLSGGLDSTSLNFFLGDIREHHHSLFLSSSNIANNDWTWAERAARELRTEHHVAKYSSVLPALVDDRAGAADSFPEGPSIASVALASIAVIEEALTGASTTLHMNGHAGDALFGPVSTMLWSVFHSKEPDRLQRVRRHRITNRYPIGKTFRMLAQTQSYSDDLRRIQRADFKTRDDGVGSFSRWALIPHTHAALTDVVHESIRQLATKALSEERTALSDDRTLHQILQYLSVHGNTVRRMNHASSQDSAIYFDSPYLDRQIVEASLALRIADRAYQDPAKPLLAAARPGSMSLEYFTRRDKGDYTAEVFEQHQALKQALKELFADGSRLEDLGLVFPGRILRSISDFSATGVSYTELAYIAFAERWLRSVDARVSSNKLNPAKG